MKEVDLWGVNIITPFIGILSTEGCSVNNQNGALSNMNNEQLVSYITQQGYYGLFLLGEKPKVDSIWQIPDIEKQLEEIYLDRSHSSEVRFLAAEIILSKSNKYPIGNHAIVLSELYGTALLNTGTKTGSFRLTGNMWGYLYEMDDVGILGNRFIQIGEKAVPELVKLLDNDEQVLYEGSKEATIGNENQYRIKDFAAFYISRIKNIPVKFYQDIEKRDKEIERLKKLLEADKK